MCLHSSRYFKYAVFYKIFYKKEKLHTFMCFIHAYSYLLAYLFMHTDSICACMYGKVRRFLWDCKSNTIKCVVAIVWIKESFIIQEWGGGDWHIPIKSDFNFLFAQHLLVVRLHIAINKRDSVWLKRGRLWAPPSFVQVHGSAHAGALEAEGATRRATPGMRIPARYGW